MNVFLDSNIFYGDWWLQSAPLRSLIYFLNNENHTLFISRLVLQEVENIHRRETEAARADLQKASKALTKLTGRAAEIGQVQDLQYDLLELLRQRVDNVTVIEFAGVEQQRVVDRALSVRRPFQTNEKGFRDTLIWMSLLDHLQSHSPIIETAFITKNAADFFQGKEKCEWHPELLEDIQRAGVSVPKPYRGLEAFLKEKVDSNDHVVDKTRLLSEVQDDLELMAESEFGVKNSLATNAAGKFLFGDFAGLDVVLESAADVIEGIEDFEVVSTTKLSGHEAYIKCFFDLRMVSFNFMVSRRFVDLHRAEIDLRGVVVQATLEDEYVVLGVVGRPYFDASFIYDTERDTCSGFTLASVTFRKPSREPGASSRSKSVS